MESLIVKVVLLIVIAVVVAYIVPSPIGWVVALLILGFAAYLLYTGRSSLRT